MLYDLENVTISMGGFLRLSDNSSIPVKANAILDDGSMAYVARDANTVFNVHLAKGYLSSILLSYREGYHHEYDFRNSIVLRVREIYLITEHYNESVRRYVHSSAKCGIWFF